MTHCHECGAVQKPTQRRSSPQHRRFFKVVSAAYDQWPHNHAFQPDDAEHLRAWLLCKVGYRRTVQLDDANAISVPMLRAAFKAAGHHAWFHTAGTDVWIISPKSMSFAEMGHRTACDVMAAIDDLICDVLCVRSTDDLLQETARAA